MEREFFSAKFTVSGSEKRFKFHRMTSDNKVYYEVCVENENHVFKMSPDREGIWLIRDDTVPTWIHDLEMELGDAIEEFEY